MKKLLLLLLLTLASGIIHAECYVRSSIRLTQGQPVDWQKLVTPDLRGQKCVMRYRVQVSGNWKTAEGAGYGPDEGTACAQAIDINRGSILEEMTPQSVRADTQMVCSDLPEITVHAVRIGDIIWQSETDIHSIPTERKDFVYKRSVCRMFVERDTKNANLWLYQGVICKMDATPNSKWRVIDKY